jgi:hypothetical protein
MFEIMRIDLCEDRQTKMAENKIASAVEILLT